VALKYIEKRERERKSEFGKIRERAKVNLGTLEREGKEK
jgi:hypothetical protein